LKNGRVTSTILLLAAFALAESYYTIGLSDAGYIISVQTVDLGGELRSGRFVVSAITPSSQKLVLTYSGGTLTEASLILEITSPVNVDINDPSGTPIATITTGTNDNSPYIAINVDDIKFLEDPTVKVTGTLEASTPGTLIGLEVSTPDGSPLTDGGLQYCVKARVNSVEAIANEQQLAVLLTDSATVKELNDVTVSDIAFTDDTKLNTKSGSITYSKDLSDASPQDIGGTNYCVANTITITDDDGNRYNLAVEAPTDENGNPTCKGVTITVEFTANEIRIKGFSGISVNDVEISPDNPLIIDDGILSTPYELDWSLSSAGIDSIKGTETLKVIFTEMELSGGSYQMSCVTQGVTLELTGGMGTVVVCNEPSISLTGYSIGNAETIAVRVVPSLSSANYVLKLSNPSLIVKPLADLNIKSGDTASYITTPLTKESGATSEVVLMAEDMSLIAIPPTEVTVIKEDVTTTLYENIRATTTISTEGGGTSGNIPATVIASLFGSALIRRLRRHN